MGWLKFNADSLPTFPLEADITKSFKYGANENVATNAAICTNKVNNMHKKYPNITLRFSSFSKLTRVTAYLLRYIDNLK